MSIMACTREAVVTLYRNLIRESKKWKAYNFRMYALRKIRYEFELNKELKDQVQIEAHYKKGLQTLDIIKRQTVINNLYDVRPLVIETKKELRSS